MAPLSPEQMRAAQMGQSAGKSGVLGGLGAGIGAGIAYATSDDIKKAEELRDQYLQSVLGLDPQELARVKAEAAGTEFSKVQEPGEGRTAQLRALERLQQMQLGEDPESAAAYARGQAEAAQIDRGIRQAALQRLAQRGAGATSGLALAAQMDAAQAATQQASMRDLEVAAEARRRALAALSAQGQLGGQLRQQDYQRLADRAQAQDIINRFNAQQRMQQAGSVYGAKERRVGAIGGAQQMYQQAGAQDVAVGSSIGQGVGSVGDVGLTLLPMAFGAPPLPVGG
jgi:hypothetical protein